MKRFKKFVEGIIMRKSDGRPATKWAQIAGVRADTKAKRAERHYQRQQANFHKADDTPEPRFDPRIRLRKKRNEES